MSGAVDLSALPDGWERWPTTSKEHLRMMLRTAVFRRTYRDDPVAFVHDCVRWEDAPGRETGPADYQDEIMADLIQHKRLAVRGPHGLGKTGVASWLILWFALTRDGEHDWKCPTTASAWRQLKEFLWPEVHKWARLLRWDAIGRDPFDEPRELQDMALRLSTGSAFAVASNEPAKMEGGHADELFFLYDEAKTIPEESFEATEGAFSGAGEDTGRVAYALAESTPGEPQGRFYDIHRRDPRYREWHAKHVSKERAIAAGRLSRHWVEEKAEQWGTTSPLYLNRVEGEFAAAEEQATIPLSWVEAAIERWRALAVKDLATREDRIPGIALDAFTCGSVDVADQGDDQTAICLRHGDVITEIRTYPMSPDPMETAGHALALLRPRRGGFLVVDVIGVGSGVVARLREQTLHGEAVRIVPFNAAGKSGATDRTGELEMANLRAEAWWGMRERLDPTQPGGSKVCLPPDDEMVGDLTAPRHKTTSAGKILIESKEDIRKRIGRSTDKGDTVVMSFWARWAPMVAQTPAGYSIG